MVWSCEKGGKGGVLIEVSGGNGSAGKKEG